MVPLPFPGKLLEEAAAAVEQAPTDSEGGVNYEVDSESQGTHGAMHGQVAAIADAVIRIAAEKIAEAARSASAQLSSEVDKAVQAVSRLEGATQAMTAVVQAQAAATARAVFEAPAVAVQVARPPPMPMPKAPSLAEPAIAEHSALLPILMTWEHLMVSEHSEYIKPFPKMHLSIKKVLQWLMRTTRDQQHLCHETSPRSQKDMDD